MPRLGSVVRPRYIAPPSYQPPRATQRALPAPTRRFRRFVAYLTPPLLTDVASRLRGLSRATWGAFKHGLALAQLRRAGGHPRTLYAFVTQLHTWGFQRSRLSWGATEVSHIEFKDLPPAAQLRAFTAARATSWASLRALGLPPGVVEMNDDEDEYLFLDYFSPPVEFVYWRIGHHSMKYRQRRCVRRAHARYIDQRGPHAVARLGRSFTSDLALPPLPVRSCPVVGMGLTPLESVSLERLELELVERPRPYGRDVATRAFEVYYGPGALPTHMFAWVAAWASYKLAPTPTTAAAAKCPQKLTRRRRRTRALSPAPGPVDVGGYQPSVFEASGRRVQVPRPALPPRPKGWRAFIRVLGRVGRWPMKRARKR